MSPGDAAAVGAVAGAAAAAAVSGGMSAGAGASEVAKGLPAIPDAMRSSMSNDSPTGAGGAEQQIVGDLPPRPPKAAEMSLAEMRGHRESFFNKNNSSDSGSTSGSNSGGTGSAGNASPSPSSSLSSPANRPLPGQEAKSPNPTPTASSGSGESAGIGGNPSATDQKLDKLMEAMSQPNKEPSLGDRLGSLNNHLINEQAAVHVSVNTNHEH